ncbi:hypothetical protein AXG93_3546s1100 [Marchantia polymorpha subsp. ruderalis]|uniref:Uncharacterized protein n=1 Tax=Marchantia polymorpha subsp. ruderalis TaxID=1480154 RepID=A0A176WSU6_MARPO|nr:hypothetical protein AXG93_3546s1100 [Marchantia polymorpha subsp. ruderalis]
MTMWNGSGGVHFSGDEEDSNGSLARCVLSKRGSKALKPFSPYIQAVNEAKAHQWTPKNTDGYFLRTSAATLWPMEEDDIEIADNKSRIYYYVWHSVSVDVCVRAPPACGEISVGAS